MEIPTKLFGRIYKPYFRANKARMTTMWNPTLPEPPDSFDVDSELVSNPPLRMYDNDVFGDCIIAARANQQVRFTALQSKTIPVITDDEVESEYVAETGGPDTGLIPEDSFALWQIPGWVAAGCNHKISLWGRVDATNALDVKRTIWLLQGMQLAVQLPLFWRDALMAGEPWDAPTAQNAASSDAELGSWGGHGLYVCAFDLQGITVLTWGQRQLITWAGLAWAGSEVNMGEAAGIVRSSEGDSAEDVDIEKLATELKLIQA